MGWRIVKQPNGKYGRFSDIVDHFTHIHMTRAEALELCLSEGLSEDLAQDKVQRADDMIDRWQECLADIRTIHGDIALQKWLSEYETLFDPKESS